MSITSTCYPAIIVDIDSTLSDNQHRQHFIDPARPHKDWKSFYESMTEDTVNSIVADYVRYVHSHPDARVVIVTGRPEEYRPHTEEWLAKHQIPYVALYMRPDGDYRKDTEVKREIYEKSIHDQYFVQLVLEDRSTVVAMWRSLGLQCWQVCEGAY